MIRYRPAPPLDAFVDCFWWSQRSAPLSTCEHMLPSGSTQMVFALHETPIICSSSTRGLDVDPIVWSRGLVHGPQWSYFVCGPKPRGAVAGVSFRPGAAGAVLGVPMIELADRHVSIEALWGARGLALHERLAACREPSAVFRVLEFELTARIRRPLLMHPAVAHALAFQSARVSTRIVEIQRQTGYSPRHFIALFRAAVGLTPKHYFRVKRFTGVLQRLAAHDSADLAGLAAVIGYSDQSHLCREFREFAGISPTEYRPRGSGSVFHHQSRHSIRAAPAR